MEEGSYPCVVAQGWMVGVGMLGLSSGCRSIPSIATDVAYLGTRGVFKTRNRIPVLDDAITPRVASPGISRMAIAASRTPSL